MLLARLLFPAFTLAAITFTATSASGQITPFEVCQTYNPATTKLQTLLGYDSAFTRVKHLDSASIENYFTPGEPDLGQPGDFYPGTDNDFFAVSFYAEETDFVVWLLDDGIAATKTTVSLGSAPPCSPAYFQPAPTLSYTAPGTYTNQLLGTMAMPPTSMVSAAYPTVAGANVSVANLNWTLNSPPNAFDDTPSTQSLYGDVTVGAGPAVATGMLITISDTVGRQLALGLDSVAFSGVTPSSTGCAANVTSSVQGNVGNAAQLFGTQIWTQTVTIKNTSGSAITGPIQLVLNNLSSNARLFTAAGTATCPGTAGSPYITIANGLAPNAYGAVVLIFTNSTVPSSAITYTPMIVAGGTKL